MGRLDGRIDARSGLQHPRHVGDESEASRARARVAEGRGANRAPSPLRRRAAAAGRARPHGRASRDGAPCEAVPAGADGARPHPGAALRSGEVEEQASSCGRPNMGRARSQGHETKGPAMIRSYKSRGGRRRIPCPRSYWTEGSKRAQFLRRFALYLRSRRRRFANTSNAYVSELPGIVGHMLRLHQRERIQAAVTAAKLASGCYGNPS